MQHAHSISVVVPVYNEEDNLRPLAEQVRAALAPLGREWELLLVDDGSRDRSLAVMRELAAADPHVRYLAFAANQGQSAAFAAGFANARCELIVTMDADLQNDPADVPGMLALFEQGYDMVCGLRARRRDTFMKRLASRVGNAVRTAMTGRTVTDTGCSLKIMRADMARRMPPFKGMHRFLPNLMAWQGARLAEMPVNHRPRTAGVSKYGTIDRAISGGWDLLGMQWLRSRFISYEIKEKN